MGRKSDVRNVWVLGTEDHSTVDPTLLDSLAEDLVVLLHTNVGDIRRRGSGDDHPFTKKDIASDPGQDVASGEQSCPICDRFTTLEEDVDVPHRSESDSLFVVGRMWCTSALQGHKSMIQRQTIRTQSMGRGAAQPDVGEVALTVPTDEVGNFVEFAMSLSQIGRRCSTSLLQHSSKVRTGLR